MSEGFDIQLDYVCVTPLVIAMAMIAFRILCHSLPMKTLLLLYIRVDFLMAVTAQHILALLAESLVAFFTLLLVFHMSLNHRPRFNQ